MQAGVVGEPVDVSGERLTRRQLLKSAGVFVAAAGGAAVAQYLGFAELVAPQPNVAPGPLPWPEAQRIIEESPRPIFPELTLDATGKPYGAVGDGRTDNTAAFKSAIEDCASRGGGHVVVPPGVYVTGAVRLITNVDLHVSSGAVLRFSGNAAVYPLVLTRYEGIECLNRSPMVYAYGESNIALTGAGVLDASTTRAWNSGSDRAGILEPLVAAGVPPEERIIPDRGRLRSAFVEPYRCTGVLIQGVTLRQSQFWQLHPTLCANVHIDDVTTGSTNNPNTDGCNPESCDHVLITGCTLDAFDDCVAVKSGRDDDGRRIDTPCQNVVIMGCRFQGPAGGVAFGSEMTGGIRNVYVHDSWTHGSSVHHMVYVKSNTRRGGYAENLNFNGLRGDRLSGAWARAQMDYEGQTGDHRPVFKDWSITRSSSDFVPWVLQLAGLGDDHIDSVRMNDSRFTRVLVPLDFNRNLDDVRFERVTYNGLPVMS